ncbi:hypothetical protein F4808DRAFT_442679 [Astrocystis sublimbata]|nr:hypothetical protein F4808DRAFT_442679 [Astrocystis sublimbata]
MCVEYSSTYPCGHVKVRHEICGRAKAANMLRFGKPPPPCNNIVKSQEAPDLRENCGSTCLTRPYQCTRCGQQKNVSWFCSNGKCKALRDNHCQVHYPCPCTRHPHGGCRESVVGRLFCKNCLDKCAMQEEE